MDLTLIERRNLRISETSIYVWHESHKDTVSDGECKEYIFHYRKWLRKLYVYSNNIYMSDEDNNHDTNYINKFHEANHDTRKLHM